MQTSLEKMVVFVVDVEVEAKYDVSNLGRGHRVLSSILSRSVGMAEMKIDFKVHQAEKANGTDGSTSSRWFQTSRVSRVADCSSLLEIDADVNLMM